MSTRKEQNGFTKVLYNQVSLGLAIIALLGAAFAVQAYFSDPTNALEIKTAVFEERMLELKYQMTNLKENDLHTIELKQTDLNSKVDLLSQQMVELKTIINERLPAKK